MTPRSSETDVPRIALWHVKAEDVSPVSGGVVKMNDRTRNTALTFAVVGGGLGKGEQILEDWEAILEQAPIQAKLDVLYDEDDRPICEPELFVSLARCWSRIMGIYGSDG